MSETIAEPESCANCGATLNAEFCALCGQRARSYRRSLPPMLGELLSEAFEVDGRIVRSLKLLLFRPGELTAEFSADRRAAYISPIRLYLFASLFFFFVLSVFADFGDGQLSRTIELEPATEIDSQALAEFRATLDERGAEALDAILARDESVARRFVVGMIEGSQEGAADRSPEDPGFQLQIDGADSTTTSAIYSASLRAMADPARFRSDLLENAPLALFLLLPAYALLLKLTYLNSGRYLVEHVVFALHIHSLAFLVYAVMVLMPDDSVISEFVTFLGVGGLGVYYAFALKRYYAQGWPLTLLKWAVLGMLYGLLMLPVTALVMALTVAQA